MDYTTDYVATSYPPASAPDPVPIASATPVGVPQSGKHWGGTIHPTPTVGLRRQNEQKDLTEQQIKELKEQGFTTGLAKSLAANSFTFPLRFWVVDNSGSMNKPDGHRIIETGNHNDVKIVSCTRWEEIKECVNYHAHMAALLDAPTVFRLLNGQGVRAESKDFSVAQSDDNVADVQNARKIMNKTSPGGLTPLTEHVLEIHESVRAIAPLLEKEGQKAVIVLATDGTPTDENGYSDHYASKQFLQALRMLEGLPVWVVIRLCTDDDDVVGYYNDLDDQLELSLEVLDDFVSEAKEVYEFNSWLNYALPLHRIREMGFHDRVFDLIDERKLTKGEVRQLCVLLFGEENFDAVPDPNVDWMGFLQEIEGLVKKEGKKWNPIKKRVLPWIDTNDLNREYGDSSCAPGCVIL